jgi:hypothetical protein
VSVPFDSPAAIWRSTSAYTFWMRVSPLMASMHSCGTTGLVTVLVMVLGCDAGAGAGSALLLDPPPLPAPMPIRPTATSWTLRPRPAPCRSRRAPGRAGTA